MGTTPAPFKGFNSAETFSQMPDSLFQSLSLINDLNELKTVLYVLWRIGKAETRLKMITRNEIALDLEFGRNFPHAVEIDAALDLAVQDGFLLRLESNKKVCYFPNSPGGLISLNEIKGGYEVPAKNLPPTSLKPNIFTIYEQNIGMLTPLVSELLMDLERRYPTEWIVEAMTVGVKMNKRNLRYIEAILDRWKEEGRAEKPVRPDAQKSDQGDDTRRKLERFLKPGKR